MVTGLYRTVLYTVHGKYIEDRVFPLLKDMSCILGQVQTVQVSPPTLTSSKRFQMPQDNVLLPYALE